MPRGSKDKYTDKQKLKAEHIKESYEDKGVSEAEAEKRAQLNPSQKNTTKKKASAKNRELT